MIDASYWLFAESFGWFSRWNCFRIQLQSLLLILFLSFSFLTILSPLLNIFHFRSSSLFSFIPYGCLSSYFFFILSVIFSFLSCLSCLSFFPPLSFFLSFLSFLSFFSFIFLSFLSFLSLFPFSPSFLSVLSLLPFSPSLTPFCSLLLSMPMSPVGLVEGNDDEGKNYLSYLYFVL